MSDVRDIGNVWEVLGAAERPSGRQMSAAPLGVSVSAGPILAGIDAESHRYVLFPLLAGEAFSVDKPEPLVRLVRLRHGNQEYAGVVCLSREVDEVFTQFSRELVAALQMSTTPARDCVVAMRNWRKLFSKVTGDGVLTEEEQLGLFGELLTLNQILSRIPLADTEIWTGPDRSQHDFRSMVAAIEVKTSKARDGRRVRIHGVEQLNPTPGLNLFLAYHRLEKQPSGQTLPELVNAVLQRGIEPRMFVSQLSSCGYSDRDADRYAVPYRVVESRLYDVTTLGFPRITPASFASGALPSGVESVNYVIDLSNEPPLPLDEPAATSVYLGMGPS